MKVILSLDLVCSTYVVGITIFAAACVGNAHPQRQTDVAGGAGLP